MSSDDCPIRRGSKVVQVMSPFPSFIVSSRFLQQSCAVLSLPVLQTQRSTCTVSDPLQPCNPGMCNPHGHHVLPMDYPPALCLGVIPTIWLVDLHQPRTQAIWEKEGSSLASTWPGHDARHVESNVASFMGSAQLSITHRTLFMCGECLDPKPSVIDFSRYEISTQFQDQVGGSALSGTRSNRVNKVLFNRC